MNTYEYIYSDLKYALANGQTIEDLRDDSNERIDSYLPVYNSEIIDEWKNMPSEYDNTGWQELGYEGDADIVKLMTLDLYLYYFNLYSEVMEDISKELESVA
jgi:hypothetical protein